MFIKHCYDSNQMDLGRDLQQVLGKDFTRQNLYQLINNNNPKADIVSALYELGLDSNYYVNGVGEMFADNDTGKYLKTKRLIEEQELEGETLQKYIAIKEAGSFDHGQGGLNAEEKYDAIREILSQDTLDELAAAGRLLRNKKKPRKKK